MSAEGTRRASAAHLLLIADGFILTGALWLLLNVVPGAIMLGSGVEEPSGMGGVLQGGLWFMTTIGPIVAGAVAAWRLHARRITALAIAGMGAGVVIGFFTGFALLGGFATLVRRGSMVLPVRPMSGPPWLLIIALAIIMIGILIWPLVDAVRDLRRTEHQHTRIDAVRLGSVAIIALLAVVVAPWLGYAYESEIAEAGAFLGPIAFAGAAAVAGADGLVALVEHRHRMAESGV